MAPLLSNGARKLKPRLPPIWFLTDDVRTPDVCSAVAILPRGTGVIFRHYDAQDRHGLARNLARLCRVRGLIFLVAEDWRLAAAVGADGVHLAEHAAHNGLPSGAKLWRKQRGALLTVAAHGVRGLARARGLAADAAILSPIFPTPSHPGRAALGLTRAAGLIRTARVNVLALGGVSPLHMIHLRAAGFAGLAGISFAMKG